MKDYEIILKTIEEVSLDDTTKLDDIDARVWCFLSELDHEEALSSHVIYKKLVSGGGIEKYTRSRDALKGIRPKDFFPLGVGKTCYGESAIGETANGFIYSIYKPDPFSQKGFFKSKYLPTEELAELHAVIQAIAYTRGERNESHDNTTP